MSAPPDSLQSAFDNAFAGLSREHQDIASNSTSGSRSLSGEAFSPSHSKNR